MSKLAGLCGLVLCASALATELPSRHPLTQKGDLAYQNYDMQSAMDWFKQAALAGDPIAQNKLGSMYEKGEGAEANAKIARYWYKQAAENNYNIGLYNLGRSYEFGLGLPKPNYERARRHYQAAARLYTPQAEYRLGLMRELGKGIVPDELKAMRHYQKAAIGGIADAQYRLGLIYQNTQMSLNNPGTAMQWYVKAASQEHPQAVYAIGTLYENGQLSAPDSEIAAQWYTQAADLGEAKGSYAMGRLHEFGQGVEKDPQSAFQWYHQAADGGLDLAQYRIGMAYLIGWGGIKASARHAAKWFQAAAKQHHAKAAYQLADLYQQGDDIKQDLMQAYLWSARAVHYGYTQGSVLRSKIEKQLKPQTVISLERQLKNEMN